MKDTEPAKEKRPLNEELRANGGLDYSSAPTKGGYFKSVGSNEIVNYMEDDEDIDLDTDCASVLSRGFYCTGLDYIV